MSLQASLLQIELQVNISDHSPLWTGGAHWKISEALNASKTFHVIEGLEPETEYIVRFIRNRWVDNSIIFEDVITTMSTGEERKEQKEKKGLKK